MDNDTRELVLRLCSEAGAMMEDASVPALTAGRLDEAALRLTISALVMRVEAIRAVLGAADVLSKRQN